MKRLFTCFALLVTITSLSVAQMTTSPSVSKQNNKCKIDYVSITDQATIVSIVFNGYGKGILTEYVAIRSETTLITSDGYYQYTFPIRGIYNGNKQLLFDEPYPTPGKKNTYSIQMVFDKIPAGCTSLDISENVKGGWNWSGITITNPAYIVPHKNMQEAEIKDMISKSDDGVCGIYEGVDKQGYKLACINENGTYSLVFLGVKINNDRWSVGDVKAELRPSASNGLFKATWYMADKSKDDDVYIVFDGASMKTYIKNQETNYLKMYPTASTQNRASSGNSWSGTGFALKNGYIATNYHVVENANNISVYGVGGNFTIKYSASVIAADKINDIALLQITDSQFRGFGEIPYMVKTTTSDVGEEIFVLGYPLISTMGNEIKLTTGVLSSKTGFMGDVALYQFSAPIQPGNSGGPLFDKQGNLIGIVTAKHKGTENVGYAIKASYLNNLVESVISSSILPDGKTMSAMDLTNKVKNLEKFVFMIVCSN